MDTKQNAVGGNAAARHEPASVRADSQHSHELENRSSEEIKHRIDRTRGAMDETLNELGARLSPHSLLDDVLGWLKTSGAKTSADQVRTTMEDFGKNLGCQIRDNPVPALLVGAGLAWLAFAPKEHEARAGTRRRSRVYDEYDYDDEDDFTTEEEMLIGGYSAATRSGPMSGSSASRSGLYLPDSVSESEHSHSGVLDRAKRAGSSVADSIKDAAAGTAHAVQSAASTAGEKISEAASATVHGIQGAAATLGSAFSSAASATNEAAHRGYSQSRSAMGGAYRGTTRSGRRLSRGAEQFGRRSSQQLADVYATGREKFAEAQEEYPLAVGFGFLALGALAGLAIPRTRQEDALLGETADQLKQSAWEAGEQVVERGQEAVDNTLRAAKQAAAEQGLTADNLVKSASKVIEKTTETLDKAAKEEGIHPEQLSEQGKKVVEKTQQTAKKEASV